MLLSLLLHVSTHAGSPILLVTSTGKVSACSAYDSCWAASEAAAAPPALSLQFVDIGL